MALKERVTKWVEDYNKMDDEMNATNSYHLHWPILVFVDGDEHPIKTRVTDISRCVESVIDDYLSTCEIAQQTIGTHTVALDWLLDCGMRYEQTKK